MRRNASKRLVMMFATIIMVVSALTISVFAQGEKDTSAYDNAVQIIERYEAAAETGKEAEAAKIVAEIKGEVAAEDVAAEFEAILADAELTVKKHDVPLYSTIWSLLPPIVAIGLALLTKEVYFSLFIGIVSGALLYANFNFEKTLTSILKVGMIPKLADTWNVGIILFLVILGMIVVLMNKAGGSAAYGAWASNKIKTKKGALLSTLGLGALIFVDDYFNCLTVGSVMRPITDRQRVSRAKLAYIIDSTAAPVCIIAPISSWAAAVTGVVEGYDGLSLFIRAIPYNFYALLTILMVILISVMNIDFGPMAIHEKNAENGDLYTTADRPYANVAENAISSKGKVIDLILPVVLLIVCCVGGMVYTGGFFSGENFINAFANCDAAFGLALGSLIALVLIFGFYMIRRVLTFKEFASSLPEGFKAMVPAIMILTFAWTLSGLTSGLGAAEYVRGLVENGASMLNNFLPAIIFAIAIGLSFATGTSWGTFGILLPIVVNVVPNDSEMLIIAVSACLAGAVCGDHCSPISDTTIMASTGAQSDHINHVSTQLPYALTVAAISFVSYIIAGFVPVVYIALPVAIALLVATLVVIKLVQSKKAKA